MKRKAAVVTAVGRDDEDRVWCLLDNTIFGPGNSGRVGPYDLIDLHMDDAGHPVHILKPTADPCVGELLALVVEESPGPITKRQKQATAGRAV